MRPVRSSPRAAAPRLPPGRRLARAALALLLLLVVCAPRAAAQSFVYALDEYGHVTVNGTLIDNLPSDFDEDDEFDPDADERWWALALHGPDRYALRLDGRLSRNGKNLHHLNFEDLGDGGWIDLVVTDAGAVWALRRDGRLSRDGDKTAKFSDGEYVFRALTTDGVTVYSLRSDGAVYRDDDTTKAWSFRAGKVDGYTEGKHPGTEWDELAIDPTDGALHGLRRDGSIVRVDPGDPGAPFAGEVVAKLPYGEDDSSDKLYVALDFAEDGTWWAARANGAVFHESDPTTPAAVLPGDPADDADARVRDLVAGATGFLAVRRDGRLFDGGGEAIVNLKKDRYRALERTMVRPTLEGARNARPRVARYGVRGVAGEPIAVPVLANDTDATADELVVAVDDLPPGATYDPVTRVITWDAPVAGKASARVRVTDPGGRQRTTRFAFRVAQPDGGAKNRAPRPSRIRKARAVTSEPLVLPILVTDRDGDALTVTADTTRAPFTSGAVFDEATDTVLWEPGTKDVGRYRLRFEVTDGQVVRRFSVRLEVRASILAL